MLRKLPVSAVARVRLFHTSRPVNPVNMDAGGPSQEQIAESRLLAAKAQKKQDQELLLCKLSCFAHKFPSNVLNLLTLRELELINAHLQVSRKQEHSELVSLIQTKMDELKKELHSLDVEWKNLLPNLKIKFAEQEDKAQLISLVFESKTKLIDAAIRKKNQEYDALEISLDELKKLNPDSPEFRVHRSSW